MASRHQCRPGQGPHVVRADQRSRRVPYQSQGPRFRIGAPDDGGCGRVDGGSNIRVRRHPSNRRTHRVPGGETGCRLPSSFPGARAMTLLDFDATETSRQRRSPVLATERLTLRAPRCDDAKAIAALANDRRIAENTLRIPHPYGLADAESFIAIANTAGEHTFLITRDADVLGTCGIARRNGEEPEIGYWLGVPFWGQGYATEAARALIDHAFGDLGYDCLA